MAVSAHDLQPPGNGAEESMAVWHSRADRSRRRFRQQRKKARLHAARCLIQREPPGIVACTVTLREGREKTPGTTPASDEGYAFLTAGGSAHLTTMHGIDLIDSEYRQRIEEHPMRRLPFLAVSLMLATTVLVMLDAELVPAAQDKGQPQKEPPVVPPRTGKSETIQLFNGKNLDGWEGHDNLWSVKDGVIVAKNSEPIKVSTYLLTR